MNMKYHTGKCALILLSGGILLSACLGGNGTPAAPGMSTPVLNTMAVSVDSGPAAAAGQINHAYVTVKICAPATQQCASIDHVLLDTGSVGFRVVRSVLVASGVALTPATDAQGKTVEECVHLAGGDIWGPVATADVELAGERAAKLPVQIMDDTGVDAPPPATCGANAPLNNGVGGFGANGLLGVGVLTQDCGAACVSPNSALPFYYGCAATGVCTAENAALTAQVTNPVTMFASDNNGIIVNLPNLQNPNGDTSLSGELIFGLGTQSDNAVPATGLTVLGTDGNGNFDTTYNGGSTALKATIDSGTDSYSFNDPTIAACSSGFFNGYYCPAVAPMSVFATNTASGTVNFAIADPNSFVTTAAAFAGLASGGTTNFIWGMPFFYGRTIYIGIDQRTMGSRVGPFFAY